LRQVKSLALTAADTSIPNVAREHAAKSPRRSSTARAIGGKFFDSFVFEV
jgi:hypothetical protein